MKGLTFNPPTPSSQKVSNMKELSANQKHSNMKGLSLCQVLGYLGNIFLGMGQQSKFGVTVKRQIERSTWKFFFLLGEKLRF